jgi:hypothetical protein
MTLSPAEHDFAAELGRLGYPGFAYGKAVTARKPEQFLLDALNSSDLDARVAEGLPWLVLTYVDMDWDRLIRDAQSQSHQNRLGFAVSLASELARNAHDDCREYILRRHLETLERTRLEIEGTFCHDSMSQAERRWLREHRSPIAAHWSLLTDIVLERLPYSR